MKRETLTPTLSLKKGKGRRGRRAILKDLNFYNIPLPFSREGEGLNGVKDGDGFNFVI
jgi:hypothetical protein